MSSHILMASLAAIALSTPAWADDPAEAPIDSEMKAILLDPAEAPIDTEMKIMMFVENIRALSRESTARGDDPGTGAGMTIADHRAAAAALAEVAAE